MGKLIDPVKAGRLGGKARAENLTWQRRREIAREGGLAARGKERKPYKKRRNISGKRLMLYELLVTLHDELARGWKVRPNTPVGGGPDTVTQRVAELLRMSNKKKWKQDVKPVLSRQA